MKLLLPPHSASSLSSETTAELVAVLVAVTDFTARILTIENGTLLPFGALKPVHHSLQAGARAWVKKQTQQPLGYMEQLYTFLDINRSQKIGLPTIHISYLGLVKEADEQSLEINAKWHNWYNYFPWEDQRSIQTPSKITPIIDALHIWIETATSAELRQKRLERVNLCWGYHNYQWLEENALLRYELMYEAGLVAESPNFTMNLSEEITGKPMQNHHRRILATAISRLRSKLKYRPVIFDLMPTEFSLLQLQKSIESLNGMTLHKQNFRRLIQNQHLIEATGNEIYLDRGRPAQLYRFRADVLKESFINL